ncbi:MAG: MaoC family dehydratase [Chloroflexi bacterium]|nr:MaoC family dehydratase [Chloroflexota bacterium]
MTIPTASKATPVGYELIGVKKVSTIQVMGSRYWGRINPLHWDPVIAKQEGLRSPIQTGQMSSAYLAEMLVNFFGKRVFENSRIQRKYIKPIYPGDTITTHGIVREKTPEGAGYRFKVEIWCDDQNGELKTHGWAEIHVD